MVLHRCSTTFLSLPIFSRNKYTLPLVGWLAYRGNRVANKIDGKLFSRAVSMVFKEPPYSV